jgi:hypothetical protein
LRPPKCKREAAKSITNERFDYRRVGIFSAWWEAQEDRLQKKAASGGRRTTEMPYRTFIDSLGTDWQVWDIVPRLSERRSEEKREADIRDGERLSGAYRLVVEASDESPLAEAG